jgi:phosphate-selective porin OprO/OprP
VVEATPWSAASIGRIGLEAAWQAGPFRLQAEYILTEIGRSGGAPPRCRRG